MSVSIFRKDFLQLDEFHQNGDTHKAVLPQLSTDLLNNGFNDVGPVITKITLTGDQLDKYIHEFMCYNYDTNVNQIGKGAYGIKPWDHRGLTTHAPQGIWWTPNTSLDPVFIDTIYNESSNMARFSIPDIFFSDFASLNIQTCNYTPPSTVDTKAPIQVTVTSDTGWSSLEYLIKLLNTKLVDTEFSLDVSTFPAIDTVVTYTSADVVAEAQTHDITHPAIGKSNSYNVDQKVIEVAAIDASHDTNGNVTNSLNITVRIDLEDVIAVAKWEGIEEGKQKPSEERSEMWMYTTGTFDYLSNGSLSFLNDSGIVIELADPETAIAFIEFTNIYYNKLANHPSLSKSNYKWHSYISNEYPQCRQNAVGRTSDGSHTLRDTFGNSHIWNLDRVEQYDINTYDEVKKYPEHYQKTWQESPASPPLEDLFGSVWYMDDNIWKNRYEELNDLSSRLGHWTDPAVASLNGTNTGETDGNREYYGSIKEFGPNTELFSYLNPYPLTNSLHKTGTAYTYDSESGNKNRPINGRYFSVPGSDPSHYDTKGGVFNWNPGYHGIGDVGFEVYKNEYAKILKCITNTDRGVRMGPVSYDTRINDSIIFQNLHKYKTYSNASGNVFHDFYLIGEHESNFFTPGVVEDVNQETIFTLGLSGDTNPTQTEGLQLGDVYVFNFQSIDVIDNDQYSTRVKVHVKDTLTQPLVDDLFEELLNTNFANTAAGLFTIEKSNEIDSAINITSNNPKFKYLGIGTNGTLEHWSHDFSNFVDNNIDQSGYFNISFVQESPDQKFLRKEPVIIQINVEYPTTLSEVMDTIVETVMLSPNWSSNINMHNEVDANTGNWELFINTELIDIIIESITCHSDVLLSPENGTRQSVYAPSLGGFVPDDIVPRFSPVRYSFNTVSGVPTNAVLTSKVNDYLTRNKKIIYGSLSTWTNTTDLPTYINGYVPGIRLGPFDRASITTTVEGNPVTTNININGITGGESLEFTFTGLVNETLDTPWIDTDGITLSVRFIADDNLSLIEMLIAIKNTLESESYIRDYMNVRINGPFIIIEYKSTSSAYMVRSNRAPNDYGFLNIPSNYWNTHLSLDADIIENYNSDSILGDNETYTTDDQGIFKVGRNNGKVTYGIDYNGILVSDIEGIGTAGVSASFKSPNFEVALEFFPREDRIDDPLTNGYQEVLPYVISGEDQIQIEFPYAVDLGTLANSPIASTGHYYSPLESPIMVYNRISCRYPVSYKQHVLQQPHPSRAKGPFEGFRSFIQGNHPSLRQAANNVNNIGVWKGYSHWNSFCDFFSFKKITDFSMGPILLESDPSNSLSGLDGEQGFRIRFDVVDGEEVTDTSALIHDSHKDILFNSNKSFNIKNITKEFTYLQVNIATKYQLKSDGSVQGITPKTGSETEVRIVRPSGYLGTIRPQFFNYSKSQSHVIDSLTNRDINNNNIKSLININDARVGWRGIDWSSDNISTMKRSYIFQNTTNITRKETVSYTTKGITFDYKQGLLEDGEYKWENSWMTGSSHELLEDLKYNTENERMSKGWFKRSGRTHDEFVGQYPMNYHLTILNHGISLYISDQGSTDKDDDFAWFVIQRHVDQSTGEPDFASASQPLHCVYMSSKPNLLWSDFKPYFTWSSGTQTGINVDNSITNRGIYNRSGEIVTDFWITEKSNSENPEIDIDMQSRFKRFVIRETDIVKPWDRHLYAGIDTIDSHSIINPLEQLSFTDDGKLIINFATRISNQRVIYGTSELDMFAFTDAGAIGEDSYTDSVRYGDNKQRIYKGLASTRPYGNGMRILFLVSGYGVQDTIGFITE